MTQESALDLLVLHAVRIVGFADTPTVARRFGVDPAETDELLRDAEAYGWVQHAAFADLSGWSLTERGRTQDERLLAADDRLATNDHSDAEWDTRVLEELAAIAGHLSPLADRLEQLLARFRGYDGRFAAAVGHARAGDDGWVDRTDIDSCHRVWFELHEDLVATLGIDRNAHP